MEGGAAPNRHNCPHLHEQQWSSRGAVFCKDERHWVDGGVVPLCWSPSLENEKVACIKLLVTKKKALTVVCAHTSNSSLECPTFIKCLVDFWRIYLYSSDEQQWINLKWVTGRNGLSDMKLSGAFLLHCVSHGQTPCLSIRCFIRMPGTRAP